MVKSRKIPMEKRDTEKKRAVTFTKRRQGLFNKAAEFSILCDSQIAVIVSPRSQEKPKRKIFSFGHSSVDAVIDAFLHNTVPQMVNNQIKHDSTSLLNEINSLEETLTETENSRVELEDFENSESVEELGKLVEGLEKLVDDAKRNPKYTWGTSNCDYLYDLKDLEFGFDFDQSCNTLLLPDCNNGDDQSLGFLESASKLPESITETSPELKFSNFCDTNGAECSNSRDEDKWSFNNNNYEFCFENEHDQDTHLPYIDYWPSS